MPFLASVAAGRRRAAVVLVALAATPLLLSVPAQADPDPGVPDPNVPASDPRAECESPEFGGVFTTAVRDGVPHTVCQYIVEGHFYYDTYENGTYTGTTVYRDGATVPTERPVIPETVAVPDRLPLGPFLGDPQG